MKSSMGKHFPGTSKIESNYPMGRQMIKNFIVKDLEEHGEATSGELHDAFNKKYPKHSASINEITGHCKPKIGVVSVGEIQIPSNLRGGRTQKVWTLA